MSMEIASRIIQIRKAHNMTQTEFADRLNSTRPKIAAYELNRVNFDSAFLDYICKTFNVNEDWLLNGVGEMFVNNASTILALLASEYRLDTVDQRIVESYLTLPNSQRDVIKNYVCALAKEISSIESPAPEDEATVRVFKAAQSESHAEGEVVHIPRSSIEKLKAAKPADEI